MPGITAQLVLGADEATSRRFESAQRLMLHTPDYRCVVHMTAQGCSVGHVAYPEYPIAVFRGAWYRVCLEGRILNDSAVPLADEVAALAEAVLGEEPVVDHVVLDWILAHEGDYFIVLVTNDGKRLCAVTDPLGRLPVYFAATAQGLWLARECKFVVAAKGDASFDRVGWAEHLWMGYPLGERTLFDGVRRACGGLLLESRQESDQVRSSWRPLWSLNCDLKSKSRKPIREHAAELVETFVRSVHEGSEGTRGQVALALSGGRDSRALAAALATSGKQWIATTRLDAEGRSRADVKIARRIAGVLGVPWYLIELEAEGSDDARRLVWMKDGLNYAGMAFILAYLEQVSAQWGRATTYVTGDGGDKFMPDLRPDRTIQGAGGLLKAILHNHAILPARTAERVMGLEAGTLESELGELLRGYPENDPVQKAVHYTIYERGRKWLFEGEDRNRLFMWQFSPFYSFPVFRLAMQIPDSVKKHGALQIEFLKQLNPALAHIPDTHVPLGLDSAWLPAVLRGLRIGRRLPAGLKAVIRRLSGRRPTLGGRRSAGGNDDGGHSLELKTDSVMSPEETGRMLASATNRQWRNWQTLALLEELW